jgi:hypothetical protein
MADAPKTHWVTNPVADNDPRRKLHGGVAHYIVEGRDDWLEPGYSPTAKRDPYYCYGRARNDAKAAAAIKPQVILAYHTDGKIRPVTVYTTKGGVL